MPVERHMFRVFCRDFAVKTIFLRSERVYIRPEIRYRISLSYIHTRLCGFSFYSISASSSFPRPNMKCLSLAFFHSFIVYCSFKVAILHSALACFCRILPSALLFDSSIPHSRASFCNSPLSTLEFWLLLQQPAQTCESHHQKQGKVKQIMLIIKLGKRFERNGKAAGRFWQTQTDFIHSFF